MGRDQQLQEFSQRKYWDRRYALERKPTAKEIDASYEWFGRFDKIKPILKKHLPKASRQPKILHLGVGHSNLPAGLYDMGYKGQTSIDFSPVVIEEMKQRYRNLDAKWYVMDIRSLRFASGSLDIAIDKGTLDAFIHGSPWDPPTDTLENVGRYVDEVARVLKPGGQWLYVTFLQPQFMTPLLQRKGVWSGTIDQYGEGGCFGYFVYIMKKG